MGIDYNAALFVGLPCKDMAYSEQISDWVDSGELESCSPYFDAPLEESLVGFQVMSSGTYQYKELEGLPDEAIKEAKEKFKALTGVDAKLYLSVHGW